MAEQKKRYTLRMPKIPGEQKTWTFTLSMPGMVTAVGSAMVVLTLFFILGLLVGRGYRPEQQVPQLAEIMPKQEHGALVNNATEPKVLTAQDLTYPETLAKKPEQPMRLEETVAAKQPPSPVKKPAQKLKKPAPAPKAAQPHSGDKIYDYVYQAASFRKRGMAEDLRGKLAGAGLNAAIQEAETGKGTWYRVVINHRGTPQSTGQMKAVLNRFGIGKPLMKKKTFVKIAQ